MESPPRRPPSSSRPALSGHWCSPSTRAVPSRPPCPSHGHPVMSRSRTMPLIATLSLWLGAMSPARSRSSGESFSHLAAAAPARLSGFTSSMFDPSFLERLPDVAPEARLDGFAQVRVLLAHDLGPSWPSSCPRSATARTACRHRRRRAACRRRRESPSATGFPGRCEAGSWPARWRRASPRRRQGPCARNASRIDFAPFFVSRPSATPSVSQQEPLQGLGFDVGLGRQRLRGRRGGGEALQFVALLFQQQCERG